MNRFSAPDAALLFLRVTASVLVHGLPKALHYASQLDAIEDPLHLGKTLTLAFAIFAEVVCPLLMIAGIATRLAALPIMLVSVIALGLVHREWTLDQGQFAWMLLILFGTIAIGGTGATGSHCGRVGPGNGRFERSGTARPERRMRGEPCHI